ncbi:MAG: carbohydrate ABC transporter permease [bacterium]
MRDLSGAWEKKIVPYIFILPMIIGLFAFRVGPIIWSFVLSFTKYSPLKGMKWIGLANYREMVHLPLFWKIIRNTFLFSAMYTPLSVVVSLLVAILVNRKLRGIILFRSIYFLPVVGAVAAIGAIWAWLLNPLYGLVNYLLRAIFGVRGPMWLGDPRWALFTLVLVDVWRNFGFGMVIFLAGLQEIPASLVDAALVDGANAFQRFFKVVLPLLSPTTFFVTIISIIRSFQIFDLVYIMTSPARGESGTPGGPLDSTNVLVLAIFQNAFRYNRMGYAAGLAYVLFLLVAIITFVNFIYQRRWVYYE